MALIGKPRLLIFDEPTANLDLKSREKIWALIKSLIKNKDENLSILVSTQHIEEAEKVSSRILLIKDGTAIPPDTP